MSVRYPQTLSFHKKEFMLLINKLELFGFSYAVLHTWRCNAPKLKRDDVTQYFREAGLSNIQLNIHLNGMLMSITGLKQ